MRIIGLTGNMGAGKDTVASYLVELESGVAKRQGFADLLKLSAARCFFPTCTQKQALLWCDWLKNHGLFGLREAGDWPDDEVLTTTTGREFLQHYGTEAHRDVFGRDFWLDAVLPEGRDDCDLLVIPDVRFENEAGRIARRGGEVWRIERPGHTGDGHSSEAPLPDAFIDRVIYNEGSLDDLRCAAEALLRP